MTTPLSDIEIQRELGTLPGWSRRGDTLTKTFTFRTFADGVAFVTRIAAAADSAGHHPDVDIRSAKVTASLTTHDAGGRVTQKDVELAREMERLTTA